MKTDVNLIKKYKSINGILCIVAILIILSASYLYGKMHPITFQFYETNALSYDRGTVEKIIAEEVEIKNNLALGEQNLLVKMKSGSLKGQTIEVTNYLSSTHSVPLKKGNNLIVLVDTGGNGNALCTVYSYDRSSSYIIIGSLLLLVMMLVGGKKGLRSLLGMVGGIFVIATFLIPFVVSGGSPILGTLISGVGICGICLVLLNGLHTKTYVSFLATVTGMCISVAAYFFVSACLKVNGLQLGGSEELQLVAEVTGLRVKELLFSTVLISSIGAVMDMTMSITTSLYEMHMLEPSLSARKIWKSGREMGRDMAGTMTETLAFAFLGTGIITIILLIISGTKPMQFMNSDFIAIELLSAIVGSVAVILSVPITTITYILIQRNHSKTN